MSSKESPSERKPRARSEQISSLALLRGSIDNDQDFSIGGFFRQHPSLAEREQEAVELIYEYFCLCRERDQPVSTDDLIAQFLTWQSKLEVVFECDRILTEDQEEIEFPKPGDSHGDFELLCELGRGAKGRVFLATQPNLSDRPVVLKISSSAGSEHLSLARLQHSSIVPLLFVDDDEQTSARSLCMPYLGGCTLGLAMRSMADKPVADRSGQDFVEAITRHSPVVDNSLVKSSDNPAIRFLSAATYEQSVCWIVGCLADGLHYAHQRGLVHLDVKPSNVLLAIDGQPMLLDFHLAKDHQQLQNQSIDALGGTPGYMAPEHLKALEAIQSGQQVAGIDYRCDIYSLGLLMQDLLRGASPPPVDTMEESPGRQPIDRKSVLSLGSRVVTDLLQRALAQNPNARYSSASEFATELRKVALGGKTPASPYWYLMTGVLIGAVVTALAFWSGFGFDGLKQTPPVETQQPPRVIDELHSLVTQARSSDVLEKGELVDLQNLERSCATLWSQRQELINSLQAESNRSAATRLRRDLHDLSLLYAELTTRLADEDGHEAAKQKANRIRAEAKTLSTVTKQ